MRAFAFLLVPVACWTIGGCGTLDTHLKSEPATHVPRSAVDVPVEDGLKELIKIKLVSPKGKILKKKSNDTKQAIYYSVDMTDLMGKTNLGFSDKNPSNDDLMKRRNDLIEILVFVSDENSKTFLSRAFAVDLYINGIRGVIERSFTVAQTATSLISPEATAALGLTNLLVGGLGEEYESLMYAEKTFDALRAVIEAERAKIKLEIEKGQKRDYKDYTIQDALSDVGRLAEASSIQVGVSKLLAAAEQERATATENLDKVARPEEED